VDGRSEDADDYELTHLESALGWGGVQIGPDGVGHPIPEAAALASAIPVWVDIPEHHDDAVQIYVEALSRPEVPVRLAAATAVGAIARRYRRLPRADEARAALAAVLGDPDPSVRAAAEASLRTIREVLGR
jgi:HEAT repeat protein